MADETKQLLQDVWSRVLDAYFDEREGVFDYQTPAALERLVDFSLPLEPDPAVDPATRLGALFDQVIAHSPLARHPNFLNYLYSQADPVGLLADWMISLINSNVHVYEASPVFTVAELELVAELNALVGYGGGSGGIFCPGSSYANMLAMHCARVRYVSDRNVSTDDLAVLTSDHSHYSVDRAASVLGIRQENVFKVECDERGRLIPAGLERTLAHVSALGKHPFFVCATSGTTVLGGFDPLGEIASVVRSVPGLWLHVDGAWGGPVLFSEDHRHLMAGVEATDSLAWDFHKALGAPIFCSALLVANESTLDEMFERDGAYLFHDDAGDSHHDLGRRTAQCGRRGDAFKFWLMWKLYGRSHFSRQVTRAFGLARAAVRMIQERECFALYREDLDYLNVCFWYIPKAHRPCLDIGEIADPAEISATTRRLYTCLKKDGRGVVNYADVPGCPTSFRLVTSNPNASEASLAELLDIVESLGDVLSLSLEELLISGGDERLDLDQEGLNYTFTSPTPRPGQVMRSSCTSSSLTVGQQGRAQALLQEIRSGNVCFATCMGDVHDRLRNILLIDEQTSIVTTPSGTDSEYVPLLIAKARAGAGLRIVNIMTGAGEIGSSSAIAAAGRYFRSTTPAGSQVEKEAVFAGFEQVRVIEVNQRDPETGTPSSRMEVWAEHVKQSLQDPNALVLLHILESSKLGYRLEEMEKVDDLLSRYKERLLVVVDACQSRTDISRVRIYLKLGCMVMITGSKFEEGPPYSGAVVVPRQITEGLSNAAFDDFPPELASFITRTDVSGPLSLIESKLRGWMNWGLMLRWTLALDNWQAYRDIDEAVRTRLIRQWVEGVVRLLEDHPCLVRLGGGEQQPGSVGDANTIVSIQPRTLGRDLNAAELRKVYRWMTEDMSARLPASASVTEREVASARESFLLGQPVDLGKVAVLRVALGATMVIEMADRGLEPVLEADRRLLSKLALMTTHFEEIEATEERA